jgi:hypothetical protein
VPGGQFTHVLGRLAQLGGANRPSGWSESPQWVERIAPLPTGGGSSRPACPTPGTGPDITSRASHVEPDRDGYWWADMGPSGGPVLGRTEALGAEREWLLERSKRVVTTPLESPFYDSPHHFEATDEG